jgi:hypothetical protein
MKTATLAGATSQIRHVFIGDSASTSGAGKTALAFGDITAYYVRAGGALTALTLIDLTTLGTWDTDTTDDKLAFKKLDDTNAPGVYEIHLPNNILSAGAATVVIQLRATGAVPCNLEIQLANVPADQRAILATALTETSGGRLSAAASKFGDVATPVATAASVNQTGDSFTLLGTLFSGITSLAQWLGLIAGKQVGNGTARTELRATGAGSGTFDETVDSLEAGRDNQQVAAAAALAAYNTTGVAKEASLAAKIPEPLTFEDIGGVQMPKTSPRAIDGSAAAATKLSRSAKAIGTVTIGAASTTTNIVTSACDPAGVVVDQFKGRILIFDDTTTTAELRGQATDILSNTDDAAPVLTVTALTTAPVSTDTATIT